ncbi:MAG TPA: hypothetical protein VFI24_20880 [Pyrinomonadaceae bacterium]|nr:hypothetical protein [Pyrinomonadaceae bacterium]
MGGATITKEQENGVRLYLFGQLPEADEESFELRLLTDPSFVEEFDTVVDEVTDQYLRDELSDSERSGFEKNYLRTSEGQQKIRFATELLDRAANRDPIPKPVEPGLLDQLRAFWQSQSMRLAVTSAAVVIIAGGFFLISKSTRSNSAEYAQINLSIRTSNRAEGLAPEKVTFKSKQAGLQAKLTIPESERGATNYRVKLVGGDGPEQDLAITERDNKTVTVKIPVSLLHRGNYALQISRPEGRIQGSYFFDIE